MTTIEIPTPSADLLQQVENIRLETAQTETAAIAAIREKFGPYAKHNGFIRTARYYRGDSNYTDERDAYYRQEDGKRLRGLLAYDNFTQVNSDQNTGRNEGFRLYLTADVRWLKVERVGHWTQWQGSPSYWYAGESAAAEINILDDEAEELPSGGNIEWMSDADVVQLCNFAELLKELGKTMESMRQKLPERYARLKERAELAQRTLNALQ